MVTMAKREVVKEPLDEARKAEGKKQGPRRGRKSGSRDDIMTDRPLTWLAQIDCPDWRRVPWWTRRKLAKEWASQHPTDKGYITVGSTGPILWGGADFYKVSSGHVSSASALECSGELQAQWRQRPVEAAARRAEGVALAQRPRCQSCGHVLPKGGKKQGAEARKEKKK